MSLCFLEFSVGVRAFCHTTASDLFLFLLKRHSWTHDIGHCIYSFQRVCFYGIFTASNNSKNKLCVIHLEVSKGCRVNRGPSIIEKVPRGIRGEKSSKDMAESRNLVSTIGAQANPKMGGGGGTKCPEG